MPIILWNDSYSVRVREIDEQHQRLIALINALYEAMTSGRGKDVLSSTLSELVDYTRSHFSYEEQRMRACQYPDYAAHKKEHEALTERVVQLQKRHEMGEAALTVEVMVFLKEWLTNHILEKDKKYSPYMNKD